MDAAAFEQVYGAFGDFHAYFAPLFGRRETREHSGHYLQALLVQSGERRNAENLSETVPGSARGMQRFLTDSPWDDEAIIGRLQEYLGTRLEHPDVPLLSLELRFNTPPGTAHVCWTESPRQYCGRLGKVANCQAGMFLAYVSPLGRALVDKRLYLPESWTSDKDRCEAAGVPEDRQGYRSKTELALEMVGLAQERGHLRAGWVAADDAFGMSPSFRDGLAALGMWYVLDVPSGFTVWPPEPAWTSVEYRRHPEGVVSGNPLGSQVAQLQGPLQQLQGQLRLRPVAESRLRHTEEAAPGHNVPRGCVQPAGVSPAKSTGPFTAGIWTAANSATICPMHRRIPRWRRWPTWAVPGGALKRSSRRRRATWGWTSTRPAPGLAGITMWPCACWAELFC